MYNHYKLSVCTYVLCVIFVVVTDSGWFTAQMADSEIDLQPSLHHHHHYQLFLPADMVSLKHFPSSANLPTSVIGLLKASQISLSLCPLPSWSSSFLFPSILPSRAVFPDALLLFRWLENFSSSSHKVLQPSVLPLEARFILISLYIYYKRYSLEISINK